MSEEMSPGQKRIFEQIKKAIENGLSDFEKDQKNEKGFSDLVHDVVKNALEAMPQSKAGFKLVDLGRLKPNEFSPGTYAWISELKVEVSSDKDEFDKLYPTITFKIEEFFSFPEQFSVSLDSDKEEAKDET